MILNEEFLRMQKLAGIKPVNNDITLADVLTELYLYEHYYSKGILKENISEGIIDKIKNKFKEYKPTIKLVGLLKAKFNSLSKKLGVDNPEASLKAIQDLPKEERTPEKIEALLKQSSTLKEAEKKDKIDWRGLALLAIYLTSFILKLTPGQAKQVDDFSKLSDTNKAAQEINIDSPPDAKTGDLSTISWDDALKQTANDLGASDNTKDAIDDISDSIDGGDANPVSVDGKVVKTGFDIGEYKIADGKKDDIAKKIAQSILDLVPDGKQVTGGTIDPIGAISDTPGGNDNVANDGSKDLKEKRLQTAKDLWPDVVKALKSLDPDGKKISNPDDIKLGEGKTEIGGEAGKEGDKNIQTLKYDTNGLKIDDIKKTSDDTKKTDGDKVKATPTTSPDLKTYLRSFKPAAPDGNKYYTILGQILPLLGPDGAFDYFYNNIKLDKEEVINDNWIAKQLETVKDEDTKKVLLWARSIKKEPKALARELNKLDNNVNLFFGKKKALKPGEKGKAMYRGTSGTSQTPAQPGPVAENISLINLLENIILEAQTDFSNIKGFDNDVAKRNLGLLTPMIAYSWDAADADTPEGKNSSIDYVSKNYKESYNDFEKNYPNITKIVSPNIARLDTKNYDKKSDSVSLKPDVKRVDTYLGKQPSLTRQVIKIDTTAELENVVKDIINTLAEKNPKQFNTNIQIRILSNAKNRLPANLPKPVKEVTAAPTQSTPSDAVMLSKLFKNNSTLQSLVKNINDEEEAIQLILRVILKYTSSDLDLSEIKNAINKALLYFYNKEKK